MEEETNPENVPKEILKNATRDIILVVRKYDLDFNAAKFVLALLLKSIELAELEQTAKQNKNQKGI